MEVSASAVAEETSSTAANNHTGTITTTNNGADSDENDDNGHPICAVLAPATDDLEEAQTYEKLCDSWDWVGKYT